MSEKQLSIKEAAAFLGVDEMYVRKLVREGKLQTVMVPIKPGSSTKKHLISVEQLEARKARAHAQAGGRADGRNKWTLYATRAEIERINAVCKELGMPLPFMPNEGMYQRRRAAAQRK